MSCVFFHIIIFRYFSYKLPFSNPRIPITGYMRHKLHFCVQVTQYMRFLRQLLMVCVLLALYEYLVYLQHFYFCHIWLTFCQVFVLQHCLALGNFIWHLNKLVLQLSCVRYITVYGILMLQHLHTYVIRHFFTSQSNTFYFLTRIFNFSQNPMHGEIFLCKLTLSRLNIQGVCASPCFCVTGCSRKKFWMVENF